MSWTYVILSSLVEGLTEFLPVSSTGHLIILNYAQKITNQDLISSFNIFIQSGAILAVVNHFFTKLIKDKNLILKIVFAFAPTAIIGLIFYPLIKGYLLDNILVVAIALIIGGFIILLLPEKTSTKTIDSLTFKEAMIIGLFQSLSIVPGSSRALTSTLGGLFVKLRLEDAINFSFLIAIPTILSATLLDLLKSKEILLQQTQFLPHFLVGFTLSFLVAKIVVSTLINTINKYKNFKYFGYYRILLGFILLLLISQN